MYTHIVCMYVWTTKDSVLWQAEHAMSITKCTAGTMLSDRVVCDNALCDKVVCENVLFCVTMLHGGFVYPQIIHFDGKKSWIFHPKQQYCLCDNVLCHNILLNSRDATAGTTSPEFYEGKHVNMSTCQHVITCQCKMGMSQKPGI